MHIWSIDLNNYLYQEENLYNILTDDERQRANAFTHKENKSFFVVTRGIVRKILSLYTNIMPHCIKFTYNDCGKPYFSNQKDTSKLYFNIAHSENFALCIIAWDREVGYGLESPHSN
ncbi:4'-phosphopantetheinyl transferase family protein [Candidatus Tisiphia endosymbiont of Temnostethus pusillus]|uniref:4'-phosphopantetheinyl transferase family protein n=1 Tax=Candidatus Tisiphia endosymbiont of Temnostethus pusillus TaxID=3139335 RepID=UPI0035C93B8A